MQSLPQEQLTTTEDEPEEMSHIEVITANQQQFTLPVHTPRRDQFTSTMGEPDTESSVTTSMIVHPDSDHEDEGDSEKENRPPTFFQSFIEQQSAFDSSVSEYGLCTINNSALPNTEEVTINSSFYCSMK